MVQQQQQEKNHTGIKYLPKRSIHNIRVPTRCCLAHDSHLARTTSSSHKVIPLQCIYLCEVNMASFCFRNLFNFYDNNVPIITALPPTVPYTATGHRVLGQFQCLFASALNSSAPERAWTSVCSDGRAFRRLAPERILQFRCKS